MIIIKQYLNLKHFNYKNKALIGWEFGDHQ